MVWAHHVFLVVVSAMGAGYYSIVQICRFARAIPRLPGTRIQF
jgi:hypothetical protein